jgi:hypothetical protein
MRPAKIYLLLESVFFLLVFLLSLSLYASPLVVHHFKKKKKKKTEQKNVAIFAKFSGMGRVPVHIILSNEPWFWVVIAGNAILAFN